MPRTNAKVKQTDYIRARVDPELKADAEAILETLGVTASDAIRMLYKQIVLRKGLPFELRIPNATTRRAMREATQGKVKTYENFDDFKKSMLGG
jgi:DNA-damage-inducible protein J